MQRPRTSRAGIAARSSRNNHIFMEPFSEVFDDIAAWVRAPLSFEPRVESAGERTDIVDAAALK